MVNSLNRLKIDSPLFSEWTEYIKCDDSSLPDIIQGFHVKPSSFSLDSLETLNNYSLFINGENDAIESSDSFEYNFHTNKYLSIPIKEEYNEFRI